MNIITKRFPAAMVSLEYINFITQDEAFGCVNTVSLRALTHGGFTFVVDTNCFIISLCGKE